MTFAAAVSPPERARANGPASKPGRIHDFDLRRELDQGGRLTMRTWLTVSLASQSKERLADECNEAGGDEIDG
jgi:hypothetical protein